MPYDQEIEFSNMLYDQEIESDMPYDQEIESDMPYDQEIEFLTFPMTIK